MDLRFKINYFMPSKQFFGNLSEEQHWHSSRIKVSINFRQLKDWDNNSYKFIFDTGAYVSIAPEYILDYLDVFPEFEGTIHGIIDKEEAKIKVKVAKVAFRFVDDFGQESPKLKGWFAFHSLNKGPLLLGMNGILNQIGLVKEPYTDEIIIKVIE